MNTTEALETPLDRVIAQLSDDTGEGMSDREQLLFYRNRLRELDAEIAEINRRILLRKMD